VCAHNNIALHEAVCQGYIEVVKFLVENGANILDPNSTIICDAAINNKIEIIKYFIKQCNNDDNLIYLLNECNFRFDYNESLINNNQILIWAIKINKFDYFEKYFNDEYDVYNYLFNNIIGYKFNNYMKKIVHLKNKYINLETLCN